MAPPPLHVLTEAEKNELLLTQYEMIERLAARVAELEALAGKPRKTSKNSHIPPSKDDFGKGGGMRGKPKGGRRPSREGTHRPLAETPDKTERPVATAEPMFLARPSVAAIAMIISTCRRSARL
jgi:transposase